MVSIGCVFGRGVVLPRFLRCGNQSRSALVLELVDRHDSGSCIRKGVEVQVLSRACLMGLLPVRKSE
jgi:hypothetical protein